MKTILISGLILLSFSTSAFAQKEGKEKIMVPAVVKTALSKKYPSATKVTWEKENGNYEANWGGKSGEDNSVQYTPTGEFIEIVNAVPVSQLPAPIITYIKAHYKSSKITEAGRVTDAKGRITYEAEVNKKDIIFDEKGNFLKVEN
jgi:hypothetical protein